MSWAGLAAGTSLPPLLATRFLTGLFDCLNITPTIMYLSEIAEPRLKGAFLNSTAISSGLGIALSYLMGAVLDWRSACAAPVLSNIVSISLFLLCQPSPAFLTMRGQPAQDSLAWLVEVQACSVHY